MRYFHNFENNDLDGWRFTQSDGKIVKEAGGNHYITGDQYVTDYSVHKDFDSPFADNAPVTVRFKIKVPTNVTLAALSCILNEKDFKSLDVPTGNGPWHSYEVTFAPPPISRLTRVRISAFEEPPADPTGLGFDDIEIIQ